MTLAAYLLTIPVSVSRSEIEDRLQRDDDVPEMSEAIEFTEDEVDSISVLGKEEQSDTTCMESRFTCVEE
jgi:hypothetical protein